MRASERAIPTTDQIVVKSRRPALAIQPFVEERWRLADLLARAIPDRKWRLRAIEGLVLAVATCAGALLGSGALTAEGQYYRDWTASLSGETAAYVVPEVPNHPGADAIDRADVVRKFLTFQIAS